LIKSKYIINRNTLHARELKAACKTSVAMCEDGKTRDKPACGVECTIEQYAMSDV